MNQPPIGKTYHVRYLPNAAITLDGTDNEPAWQEACLLDDFSFPWKDTPTPRTEFRAVCDDTFLYTAFRVHDEDIVVVDDFQDKLDVVKEDRVEIFFARDAELKQYFCVEIDPRGHVLDYSASHYRQFDRGWNCPGLRTAGSSRKDGYVVEAAIPLATLAALGLPPLDGNDGILTGVFRAEFSHGEAGETIENWISWVDPNVPTPDFHVPGAFGRFRSIAGR